MLPPREFLRQESDNVEELLKDVLRYDYIPIGTSPFYDECRVRISILNELASEIDEYSDEDERNSAIRDLASLLSTLSEQIALIERSHLGEFSWAFGTELTALAQVLSDEKNLKSATRFDDNKQSLFLITTDGGLTSYAIMREDDDDGAPNYKQRIFTIVIPRSLKHYVLLHTVLGHEVGHAVAVMPHLATDLASKILSPIEQNCKYLKDNAALAQWLASEGERTTTYTEKVITELKASWIEEIFCDIFGLALVGPAFLGSLRSLFGALDPSHEHFDTCHPPHIWRFEILARAYKKLGWDKPIPGLADGPTKTAMEELNKHLLHYTSTRFSVTDLFPPNVIEDVTQAVVDMIHEGGGSIYAFPEAATMDHLVGALRGLRPPVGQDLKSATFDFLPVDFRHILHAGWIAFNDASQTEFEGDKGELFSVLNRLCDQALVERLGVKKYMDWQKEQAEKHGSA